MSDEQMQREKNGESISRLYPYSSSELKRMVVCRKIFVVNIVIKYALLLVLYAIITNDQLCNANNIVMPNITSSNKHNNYEIIKFDNLTNKYNLYPWEIIKFTEFSKSYKQLIKYEDSKWITKLSGPSRKNILIKHNNNKYVVIKTCKPHECDTAKLTIIYNPVSNAIIGLLLNNNKTTFLGVANDKQKKLLIELTNNY